MKFFRAVKKPCTLADKITDANRRQEPMCEVRMM